MVTPAQRHKVNRDPIADPHIMLLEFWEDGEETVIRAAVNNESVVHNGETYVPTNINLTLPSKENEEVSARLTASNSERLMGRAIDRAARRINVRMLMIDVAIPDVAIVDTLNLMVADSVQVSGILLNMTLGPRASLQEPVPVRRTTRNSFPGTWRP